jgi:hypothetical protein
VRGRSIAVATHDTCSGLWFERLYVDGWHVSDFPAGAVIFNSTRFPNGMHSMVVTSQSHNPGSRILGRAWAAVKVVNGTSTPTPRVLPTGTPHSSPTAKATTHLGNLAPNAVLPPQSTCATLANQSSFPETTAENADDGTGWNANRQIWTTPAYFYANAGRNGLALASDFIAVNGNYSGSTQDIIRWAACKWGVDEDWAYAETAEEMGDGPTLALRCMAEAAVMRRETAATMTRIRAAKRLT